MRGCRPAKSAGFIVQIIKLGVPHRQVRIRSEKFTECRNLQIGGSCGAEAPAFVRMKADCVNHGAAAEFQALMQERSDGFAFVACGAESDDFRFRTEGSDFIGGDFQITHILLRSQVELCFVEDFDNREIRSACFDKSPDVTAEQIVRRKMNPDCFILRRRGERTLPDHIVRKRFLHPRPCLDRKIRIEQDGQRSDPVFAVQCQIPFQAFRAEFPGFRFKRRPVGKVAAVVMAAEKTYSHCGEFREFAVR